MNKYEAHIILNQVREGVIYPESVVIKALVTTGDIHARCFDVDSCLESRTDSRFDPSDLHPVYPFLEG